MTQLHSNGHQASTDSCFSDGVSRRRFLTTTAGVAAALACATNRTMGAGTKPAELIDTNVSIGQWPFRHEVLSETSALVAKLKEHGVTQAWAGSFDALLHKDIGSVNSRLVQECRERGQGLLVPIGAINPTLIGWEDDLRQCLEVHRMPGIRLHPNYHGYKLSDPVFEKVLQLADKHQLLVQIAALMEDERTVHPLVNVAATETLPLADVVKPFKHVRVQLLNGLRTLRGDPLMRLAATGIRFEIAMLESVNGIANLLENLPLNLLCFGSHAPFYYFESAKLKLQESALADIQLKAIRTENAERILRP